MVCEPSLAYCAREFSLPQYLLLGKGEDMTGGRNRDSIVSDATEALLGAIYLDGGFASAKEFVLKFILNDMENKQLFFDSKTILQEIIQEDGTKSVQYELVKEKFPEVEYDPISRILKVEKKDKKRIGKIAVCSAGTADIPVAEEAAQTAEYFGTNVERIYDVGVSGIHRLLSRLEVIQKANCVVAVAGMEGALASVLGGLVSRPVIGVPTSVGYGANMGGISALLTMINSCANGVAVVNIDNGYGAGYLATQINRLGVHDEEA